MTQEEARAIIVEKLAIARAIPWDVYAWPLREKDIEALEMAIKAMEE